MFVCFDVVCRKPRQISQRRRRPTTRHFSFVVVQLVVVVDSRRHRSRRRHLGCRNFERSRRRMRRPIGAFKRRRLGNAASKRSIFAALCNATFVGTCRSTILPTIAAHNSLGSLMKDLRDLRAQNQQHAAATTTAAASPTMTTPPPIVAASSSTSSSRGAAETTSIAKARSTIIDQSKSSRLGLVAPIVSAGIRGGDGGESSGGAVSPMHSRSYSYQNAQSPSQQPTPASARQRPTTAAVAPPPTTSNNFRYARYYFCFTFFNSIKRQILIVSVCDQNTLRFRRTDGGRFSMRTEAATAQKAPFASSTTSTRAPWRAGISQNKVFLVAKIAAFSRP